MRRTRPRISMALAACLVAVIVLPSAVFAHEPSGAGQAQATEGPVVADLNGHAIAVGEIPRWYCHDLDYPRIHCFATAAELERALTTQVTEPTRGATTSAPYLDVYDDANFSGAWTAIAQPYNDLGTIGWNDKISSFKALNGVAGHFATDIYNSGRLDYFCCNEQTTYVGDVWNDQFSSVYPG